MIYLRVVGVWISCSFGLLFQPRYDKFWDKKLNELLDSGAEIKKQGRYTVAIGPYIVWVGNRYYSYCTPYGFTALEVRPSIKTMIRFSDAVAQAYFK